MKPSLKDRLVRYLKAEKGWVSGFYLQQLTMEKAHQTGKSCSRRLQEAVNENLLEVKYERGAAQYRARVIQDPRKVQLDNAMNQIKDNAELSSKNLLWFESLK